MTQRLGLLLSMLALAGACGEAADPGTRVLLDDRAQAAVPTGWRTSLQAGTLQVSPDDASRDRQRVDLIAVPRKGYGKTRDTRTVLAAIRTQALSTTNPIIGAERRLEVADHPAGWLEWSYEVDGARLLRRHWVVELADSTVHVSCLGPGLVPSECDRIVASVQEVRR
jgi:hypothetical protein